MLFLFQWMALKTGEMQPNK